MKLPVLIQKYINASNDNDLKTFVFCFAENATVLDEGKILAGRKAIGAWFTKTKNKYQQQTQPISFSKNGNEILLKAKISGSFEGSPVELKYSIKTKSGFIDDLSIKI
jgi:uncharacterized protein (TIGR02246 family)